MSEFKGKIVEADLEQNTVTIKMDKPIRVCAGEYVVIPIDKYKAPEMLEMLKELVEQNTLRGYGESTDVLKANQLIKQATEI